MADFAVLDVVLVPMLDGNLAGPSVAIRAQGRACRPQASSFNTVRSAVSAWSISPCETLSAGMKRSRFGLARGEQHAVGLELARPLDDLVAVVLVEQQRAQQPFAAFAVQTVVGQICSSPAFRYSPRSRTPSRKPGAVNCSMTDRPTAVISGLPL